MTKALNQYEETIHDIVRLKELSEEILSDPIKEGKWSIIQIVGHLFFWDKFLLEKMVPLMEDGANLPAFPDHDQYNAEAMNYIKDLSVGAIIDQFAQTRKDLISSMSKLDSDARFTIGGGKRRFSGESFIKMFNEHDGHHLKQIDEKLQ